MRAPIAGAVATVVLTAMVGCAGTSSLGSVGNLLGSAQPSGDDRIVAGLKQALEIGTERAVGRTSKPDGFLGNPTIRIGLPDSLETMAGALRAVGLGARIDELEVAMNRAAEEASSEATDVFWQGIRQMSFTDARSILTGGETAATDYLNRTTRQPLLERFEPIVAARVRSVGLGRSYSDLVDRYAALPFTSKPDLNLERYVTNEALDGLFSVLGEEERRIRKDPAARSTALLKEIFR